jgi:hypothetical protein
MEENEKKQPTWMKHLDFLFRFLNFGQHFQLETDFGKQ